MRLVRDYARIRVPATTVLASSRDGEKLGVALNMCDDYAITVTVGQSRAMITGPNKQVFPQNESHPTIEAIFATLDILQEPHAGISLIGQTAIPPAAGLGARSAAVVAGIAAVRHLYGYPAEFTNNQIIEIARKLGVSPERASAILSGNGCGYWQNQNSSHIWPVELAADLPATLMLPEFGKNRDQHTYSVGPISALLRGLTNDPQILTHVCPTFLVPQTQDERVAYSAHILTALHKAQWPALMCGSGPAFIVFARLESNMCAMLKEQGYVAHETSWGTGLEVVSAT
ncbi:GHMP family kinase ATP-binding protein [Arcanobacterium buesumense]|uniref:GHMP kinase N-terminal domain-containing protein n=1 Tax=Arcanobacterium buesumense TaxID=2722751 RepID=A0A6H2EK59_9ACTO|nr:hypothetical protein [Arcanobacterium buesumense]QJC21363.1 hypothetical protein HC352_01720 [Arcanobacterium buesumense]